MVYLSLLEFQMGFEKDELHACLVQSTNLNLKALQIKMSVYKVCLQKDTPSK